MVEVKIHNVPCPQINCAYAQKRHISQRHQTVSHFPHLPHPQNRENILLLAEAVKLADFGSCKGMYSKQPYTEYISTRWYRAPECLLTDGYYEYKVNSHATQNSPRFRWTFGVLAVYSLRLSASSHYSQGRMNLTKFTKFTIYWEHHHRRFSTDSRSKPFPPPNSHTSSDMLHTWPSTSRSK